MRGGFKIQIVRNILHKVPIVVIGHLDTKGEKNLEFEKLHGSLSKIPYKS